MLASRAARRAAEPFAQRFALLRRRFGDTAVASGRKSRQLPQQVPAAAYNNGNKNNHSSNNSSSQLCALAASAPPGLLRLPVDAATLARVLQVGRSDGPIAAHAELLRLDALEADPSQAACAAVLQELWDALAFQQRALVQWKGEHAAWRGEYAAWEQEMARVKSLRRFLVPEEPEEELADNSSTAAATDEGAEIGGAPPEPPEPTHPMYGSYVWGSVGSGKSLLMDLFVDCFSGSEPHAGIKSRRVHFHEFMHEVHVELHQLREAGAEKKTTATIARRIAGEVQLLAFDEFQITNIADALIVETLFDGLFQGGVSIIMTSNRPPEDLYKDGLNRHLAIPQFLALLDLRKVAVVEVSASRDFRTSQAPEISEGRHGSQWRDYFHKAEKGVQVPAEEYMRSAFADASGVAHGAATTVDVAWGRKLAVDEAAEGVGRFTFQQICGSPLNADDYLHLTSRFHTILVADVPHFSLEQHNEARRFTNLVDCLYERQGRLIVSADAAPEQILESMTELAKLALPKPSKEGGAPENTPSAPSDWIRRNPFSAEPLTVDQAIRSLTSDGASVKSGDDDTATGAGVAGVMAGAIGALQESGFAARRATSRLLHMQTDNYLLAHRRNRNA